ncbi:hypothetical protein N9Y42_07925 [Mariniblastus sp.]|nr:hypothetical protein [Mariniblastus sp.]
MPSRRGSGCIKDESLQLVDISLCCLWNAKRPRLISGASLTVTDAGLAPLKSLVALVALDVSLGSNLTLEGVDTLKSEMPNCIIQCQDGSGVVVETR